MQLPLPRSDSGPREIEATASLTRLKWLAIVLPMAFVSTVHLLLHTVLEEFHHYPWVIILFVWVAAGVWIFSFGVFRIIGILERRVVERNQELEALLAVGRAATSSLDLDEVLDEALDAILEVTSAETAEVWLASEDGELALERQRGAAREALHERTRFRPGEGLPGLVAESGSAVVVHDLVSDPRFLRETVKELGFRTFCALPLRHRGETVGVLGVASRNPKALESEAERRLLEGIGERMAVAIENSRLHAQVLDNAVLEERVRIARELHDGLAQVLGYINTQTLAIKKLLASGRTEEAERQVLAMEEAARQVYADVREAIVGLRDSLAPSDGLIPSLERYLRDFDKVAGTSLQLEVGESARAVRLPASTEIQLVRIVQEALSNVRKHAGATTATVSVNATADELTVEVVDDGRGFEHDRPARTGWPHFGLQTMRERATAIGGEFAVSSSLGLGTSVLVRLPLRAPVEVPA